MHLHPPDEELPKRLRVDGRVSSDWATPSEPTTKGELFLLAALRSGVPGRDAARAAAGWGADGVVEFRNASYSPSGQYETGYAWAVRFDDASEGEEFASTFDSWLESTGSLEDGVYVADDGQAYRVVEVSAETYVVLAGHQAFVRQASVGGNASTVVVEHTENDQASDARASDDQTGDAQWSDAVTARTDAVVDAGGA
jgi:hypothetical protein